MRNEITALLKGFLTDWCRASTVPICGTAEEARCRIEEMIADCEGLFVDDRGRTLSLEPGKIGYRIGLQWHIFDDDGESDFPFNFAEKDNVTYLCIRYMPSLFQRVVAVSVITFFAVAGFTDLLGFPSKARILIALWLPIGFLLYIIDISRKKREVTRFLVDACGKEHGELASGAPKSRKGGILVRISRWSNSRFK